MRVDTLAYNNGQTQGAQRREWLRQHSPQHLEHCATLIRHGLQARSRGASAGIVILGAGACTEIPLAELARAADEVVLVVRVRHFSRDRLQKTLAGPGQERGVPAGEVPARGGACLRQ